MALPLLIAGAALMAAKKGMAAHEANKANAYNDAADEAERQRANAAANLYEAPQLHGAEQRKTFGNLFGLGFLSNFGRDAATGTTRNPQFAAMLADPWQYRDIKSMMAKHPTTIKGPSRPKSSVVGAAAGGALEGALSSYISGGGGNPFKSGASAPASTGFGAPKIDLGSSGGPASSMFSRDYFKLKPVIPTNDGTFY